MTRLPRYPVYIVSKGRAARPLTARFLTADRVPFRIVVEPQEEQAYADAVGAERVLLLPFSNLGLGSIPARNWIWEHARETGAERHWIFDDNICRIRRWHRGYRIPCAAGPALAALEDFTDRYENVAISGLNYQMFAVEAKDAPPFYLNVHVYSALLIRNDLPMRWRGRYNEDTDLCLQVLAAGWCTVLSNVFLIEKLATMTMRGGNTDELYAGDGRLRMAKELERAWPRVAATHRRWQRPTHRIAGNWRRFDTPLRLKPGLSLDQFERDEYGLGLRALRDVRSPELQQLLTNVPSPPSMTDDRSRT